MKIPHCRFIALKSIVKISSSFFHPRFYLSLVFFPFSCSPPLPHLHLFTIFVFTSIRSKVVWLQGKDFFSLTWRSAYHCRISKQGFLCFLSRIFFLFSNFLSASLHHLSRSTFAKCHDNILLFSLAWLFFYTFAFSLPSDDFVFYSSLSLSSSSCAYFLKIKKKKQIVLGELLPHSTPRPKLL